MAKRRASRGARRAKWSRRRTITPAQAERMAKQAARRRTIQLELTDEQMAAFSAQWRRLNPAEAAEVIFTVARRPTSRLRVAGYSYAGSTCCV
jgi:hypothetical protein